MTEQDRTKPKRPRGRPSLRTEQETRALLIKCAAEVFLSEGYAGTSIEAVARKSGMSTRTIYKTVPNKAGLFRLVADHTIETSIAHLDTPPVAATLEEAVLALARAYSHLVLSDSGVTTARAVLAEQSKFPEFRENYLCSIRTVAEAFDQRFIGIFKTYEITTNMDLSEGAALLRSMINGAQREAVLRPDDKASASSIDTWSDKCAHFALRAINPSGS